MIKEDKRENNSPDNKFTISERGGLSYLRETDLSIYSAGISTVRAVEVEMAKNNPCRTVIGSTIDQRGFETTSSIIDKIGLDNQVFVKFEDLRESLPYQEESFDYIYARLVLHYLSSQQLDFTLKNFYKILGSEGRIFVVVRSQKNISQIEGVSFNPETRLTTIDHPEGSPEVRYFHTPTTITEHLIKAGFIIEEVKEYKEKLYIDFKRTVESPYGEDHLIEVRAFKKKGKV
jgi:predicted SAM-dependent methyltransferase